MRYVIALLACAGILVSALALHVHYTTGAEPCDLNSHWDCGTVPGILWHLRAARHPDSVAGPAPRTGLPVAVVGIVGYAAILLLALARLRWFTLLFALGGLACALYLSHIEAHVLEVWCLYCVISQCLIALITLLAIAALFVPPRRTAL
jgi:vitamin-K-epoxide reductase (warfarin-sensitive)